MEIGQDEEKYWGLLEDYLLGKLDPAEQESMKTWLSQNEEARQALEGYSKLHNTLPREEDRQRYFEEQYDRVSQQLPRRKRSRSWLYAAASGLLLLSFGAWYLLGMKPSLEDLVKEHSKEHYSAPFLTREGSPEENWVDLYQNRQFGLALENLMEHDSADPTRVFYMGMCHFYLEDYEKAQSLLNSQKLEGSLYHQQATWYLALTYLHLQNTRLARQTLQQVTGAAAFKKDEAFKILDLL